MSSQHELIEQFLRLKRIAVAGVSRNPSDFTRTLWKEFRTRGYEAIPVHPTQKDVDGVPCFANVRDIHPGVQGVLVMVGRQNAGRVIADCIAAGVNIVWVYGILGEKEVLPGLRNKCDDAGIELIAGHCPFMFFDNTAWFHRMHRFSWKVMGYYPK